MHEFSWTLKLQSMIKCKIELKNMINSRVQPLYRHACKNFMKTTSKFHDMDIHAWIHLTSLNSSSIDPWIHLFHIYTSSRWLNNKINRFSSYLGFSIKLHLSQNLEQCRQVIKIPSIQLNFKQKLLLNSISLKSLPLSRVCTRRRPKMMCQT